MTGTWKGRQLAATLQPEVTLPTEWRMLCSLFLMVIVPTFESLHVMYRGRDGSKNARIFHLR